jgi:hypothetical protein
VDRLDPGDGDVEPVGERERPRPASTNSSLTTAATRPGSVPLGRWWWVSTIASGVQVFKSPS